MEFALVEAGGPTTQAGIFYQNTISALYMGRLVDFRQRPGCDRVIRLQIEAKTDVDDTIVHFADGHKTYFHIKRTISAGSKAWRKLWLDIYNQHQSDDFNQLDKICIIFGNYSELHNNIKEICDRLITADSYAKLSERLTSPQKDVIKKISTALSISNEGIFDTLKAVSVEIRPDEVLDRDFAPLWMPISNKTPIELLSHIRDIAGGDAKKRGDFTTFELLERLKEVFNVEISTPKSWNADNYRSTVINECNICIPGVPNSSLSEEAFVWPKAQNYDRQSPSDFEDESAYWFERKSDLVDLSTFPLEDIKKTIVIAGPGFGKTD